MRLRAAVPDDAAAIAALYAAYVRDTAITFETEPPSETEMRARIEAGAGLFPWLVVCDEDAAMLGYASASAFRARRAYRFSVETSVYVAPAAQGRGVGSRLYATLLDILEAQGFTQAIAAIALPNPPSVALHERFGFVPAGIYRDVGWKLGRWVSVGLWQRALAPMTDDPEEPRPLPAAAPIIPSAPGSTRTG